MLRVRTQLAQCLSTSVLRRSGAEVGHTAVRTQLARCFSTSIENGLTATELKTALDDTAAVMVPLQQGEVSTNGWAPPKSRLVTRCPARSGPQ